MGHQSIRLIPTVDVNRTVALNEAALSISQAIRFLVDQGQPLIQKLGGWQRWNPGALPSICRALWGWQDINAGKWLAAGCTAVGSQGGPLLAMKPTGSQTITPRVLQDNVAVDVTTSTSSNLAIIKDVGSNISSFDAVYVQTHISVGGVIIFGFYPCIAASADTYEIALVDQFGNPIFPTAIVTDGGAVEAFTVTSGSNVVTVTLDDHNLAIGADFPILIQTSLGGVTLQGDYIVQTVVDADNFTILAQQSATSSAGPTAINGGDARYDYYLGFGALPVGTGFGIGGFGIGGFGTGSAPTANVGDPMNATEWTLDNWASLLIACPTSTTFGSPDGTTPIGGPVFYWDPLGTTPVAKVIPQAPVTNAGAFVAMPEQQIIVWGTTSTGVQDPLLIRGCDAGDFTDWVATPSNLAFTKRLPRGSTIVVGLQMVQQLVFITDLALWVGQFIGGQDVYSWNEIAENCGCIAKKAAGVLHETLYWMSQNQFFAFSGAGIAPMPCSVWDAVFQNLNTAFAANIRCATSTYFNEVTWYYPSNASVSGENDSYVKYTVTTGSWDTGTNAANNIARSAWINQSELGAPIGADPVTNLIMQHEVSNDADGQPLISFFQTGYASMTEADVLMFVDQFWPDMKWGKFGSTPNATLALSFIVAEYPADDNANDPLTFGPYTIGRNVPYITPRFRGRLVALRFEGSDAGTFWRLGLPRYRSQPDGKFL